MAYLKLDKKKDMQRKLKNFYQYSEKKMKLIWCAYIYIVGKDKNTSTLMYYVKFPSDDSCVLPES